MVVRVWKFLIKTTCFLLETFCLYHIHFFSTVNWMYSNWVKKVERYLSMLIIKYKWNYTNIYNINKYCIQIALNSHLLTNFCATNGPTFFRVKYSKYRLVSVENFNWFFWQVRCRSRMSDKHGTRDSKISIIPIFFP